MSSESYTEYHVRRVSTKQPYGPVYRFREYAEEDLGRIRGRRPKRQFEVAERQVTVSDWRSSPHPDEQAEIDRDAPEWLAGALDAASREDPYGGGVEGAGVTCAHQLVELMPADEGLRPLPDGYGHSCPRVLLDGSLCGRPLVYAHSVREYRPVHDWTQGKLAVGDRTDMDPVPDRDTLYCRDGHEWAVPETIGLDR